MKRLLLLLCSVVIGCLSASSQNITFTASPTSVTSGNNTQVTLTASGESNTGYYITSYGSINNLGPDVTATFVSFTPFNLSTNSPSKLVVIFVNNGKSADAISPQIIANYTDVQGGTSNNNATFFSNAITVNPYPSQPTTYYNTAASVTLNKQGCGGGSMGSAVTYTVPANKYSSTVSQADAQSKATNDLNTNGQNYANANGQCILVYARLEGHVDDGEGSWVIAHYYSDAACTQPLALPAPLTHYVTWTKYYAPPLPNAGQQYTVNSQYTAAAGATYFSFGHREFYSTIPPTTIYSDWVASVVLQSDNPAYTPEPNYGVFTNN